MDWYDSLVRGATVSLSKLFDPNYYQVLAATMPSSGYSDSRGMSLEEMFKYSRPLLDQRNQHPPFMGEDGWKINRLPRTDPTLRVIPKPYTGWL